jgi:hypothetical protein
LTSRIAIYRSLSGSFLVSRCFRASLKKPTLSGIEIGGSSVSIGNRGPIRSDAFLGFFPFIPSHEVQNLTFLWRSTFTEKSRHSAHLRLSMQVKQFGHSLVFQHSLSDISILLGFFLTNNLSKSTPSIIIMSLIWLKQCR